MRQSRWLFGVVAGYCALAICVAGCGSVAHSGPTGKATPTRSPHAATGTPTAGKGVTAPSPTPSPTSPPVQATSVPVAVPPSGTGVSVGFDIAFDLATSTPWNDITQNDLFAIQTTAGSALDTTGEGLSSVNVPQWVATVHAHHRLALITIGGIDDQHWEIACNNTYRSGFVTNLVTYMKVNGFDGIDLDIEDDLWSSQGPPSPAMTTCVEAITAAAHATTTAAGARPLITEDVTTPWMGSWVAPFQAYIDQFNLMTYGDTCANQCASFNSDIQQTVSQGVPKAKMVLGVDIIDSYPPAGDCGNIAAYAAQQGLAGVMVWDIHQDAATHNGAFPCFDQLAPYTAPPGS